MKLADDNQFLKYSRYAVGEILLVVIGILIALQVNNWNEERKSQIREVKVLTEIKSELIETLNDVKNDLEDLDRNLNSAKIIYEELLHKRAYKDSLKKHFMLLIDTETFSPKTSAFESLKAIGFELITNDSIREQITTLYMRISDYKTREDNVTQQVRNLSVLLKPYLIVDRDYLFSNRNLTNESLWGRRNIPVTFDNYEDLLNNETFLVTVLSSIQHRYTEIQVRVFFERSLKQVIQNIESELRTLD